MTQHAVFFGIDGAQLSRIMELHENGRLPQLDRLFIREAYTGGEKGTQTEQDTFSGPGWSTLLTGTWTDQHGVTTNNGKQVKSAASSLFERIDDGLPGADIRSHSTWSDINDGHFRREMATVVDEVHTGGKDRDNLQLTLDAIADGEADFIFNHYDKPDHVGHASGFGKKYDDALIDAVKALIKVLDAIEARQADHPDEDWLLIAATDHGRGNGGYDHGGQSAQERQSFIISNKPLLTGDEPVAVTSVTTTILDHLDIRFDMEDLVSQSILDDDDANDGTSGNSFVKVWSENFESLSGSLRAYKSPTEHGGDGTDWTNSLPTDWTRDNGDLPKGGPKEFRGWRLHDKESWIDTADDQGRSSFTRGKGVVAVADSDEYADGFKNGSASFNTLMRTGEIDISAVESENMRFTFDSSFRAGGSQTAVVRMSLDGGATFSDILQLASADIAGSKSHINDSFDIDVDTLGSDTITFEFGLTDANNDWWWAIDNIALWAN